MIFSEIDPEPSVDTVISQGCHIHSISEISSSEVLLSTIRKKIWICTQPFAQIIRRKVRLEGVKYKKIQQFLNIFFGKIGMIICFSCFVFLFPSRGLILLLFSFLVSDRKSRLCLVIFIEFGPSHFLNTRIIFSKRRGNRKFQSSFH